MKRPSVPVIVSAVLLATIAGAGPACDEVDKQIRIAVTVSPARTPSR
jgi:hypothetical protein